jgi:hypothetical protein
VPLCDSRLYSWGVSEVVVGVLFPYEGETRADDQEWLQELAGSCGAEWPDVMSASSPGQVGLSFPTVEAADRFVLGLQREGRFSIVRRTVLWVPLLNMRDT